MQPTDNNLVNTLATQPEEIKPVTVIKKKRAPKHDFKDGRGKVFAHKHDNGKGWVEDTATVDDAVYVGSKAEVYNFAQVRGYCRLENQTRVYGSARISDRVVLKKYARVYGRAVIRDEAELTDNVRVEGHALVAGTSRLQDSVIVREHAYILHTILSGGGNVSGYAMLIRSSFAGLFDIADNVVANHATSSGRIHMRNFAQILHSTISMASRPVNYEVSVRNFAVIADNTSIAVPIDIKDHVVMVRSVLHGNDWAATERSPLTVGNNVVFSHNRFTTCESIRTFISAAAFAYGNTRTSNTQTQTSVYAVPAPSAPVRPPIQIGNTARRVMSLQGAS
jgi:acyl-[acyl carrier protein]--UDP-N-acetylglucosamine O-acyltransferase